MTTTVVVQARMGSTRFPGKAMAPLAGMPMFAHVLRRARRARLADRVVLATTTMAGDDELASAASAEGVSVVRGPSEDVLSRFRLAAEQTGASVVVRVTGDCPLLDPRLLDRVIRLRERSDADYANNISPPSYPDGYDVEVLTIACLGRLDAESTRDFEREHVTVRARENQGGYRAAHLTCRVDYSWMRLTIDVPEDLARAEAVLTAAGSIDVGLGGVLRVLRDRPDLREVTTAPERDERYLTQLRAARVQEPRDA